MEEDGVSCRHGVPRLWIVQWPRAHRVLHLPPLAVLAEQELEALGGLRKEVGSQRCVCARARVRKCVSAQLDRSGQAAVAAGAAALTPSMSSPITSTVIERPPIGAAIGVRDELPKPADARQAHTALRSAMVLTLA